MRNFAAAGYCPSLLPKCQSARSFQSLHRTKSHHPSFRLSVIPYNPGTMHSATPCPSFLQPMGVHLGLTGTPGEMLVSWTSKDKGEAPEVRWGTESGQLAHTAGATTTTYTLDDMCGVSALSLLAFSRLVLLSFEARQLLKPIFDS